MPSLPKSNTTLVLLIGVVLLSIIVVYLLISPKNQPISPTISTNATASKTGLTQQMPTIPPTQAPSPELLLSTPESVTKEFYEWYMTYSGDPLASAAYKTNSLLTEYFVNLVTEFQQAHMTGEPYDPIFCISNKTKDMSIGEASYTSNASQASVMIYRSIDSRAIYKVILIKENNLWRIKDIMCQH